VPARQADVEAVARSAMTRHCGDFTAGHQERSAREAADLERWLLRRTEEICGPSRPATLDLFDADRNADDWRTLTEPLDRLAAFAADAGNPPPRRQAANETFRQFHHRAADRADRSILLPPTVRPLGMLMLIPARLDG